MLFVAEEFIVDDSGGLEDEVPHSTDATQFIPTLPTYEGKGRSRVGARQGRVMASSATGRQRLGLTGFKMVSVIVVGQVLHKEPNITGVGLSAVGQLLKVKLVFRFITIAMNLVITS